MFLAAPARHKGIIVKRTVVAVLSLLCALYLFSTEPENTHTIDSFLKQCMERDPSTFGTVACIRKAGEMWEKELNRNYTLLLAALSGNAKKNLIKAQKKWLKYREAEIRYTAEFYGSLQGTMYRIFAADRVMSITRERALKFAQHLELFRSSR